MALRFLVIAAATALLAAIAICSLTSSPNMREMWWIPGWLGEWADRHPYFRNFPPFAALSFVLFAVFTFYQVGRRGDLSRKASVLATRHLGWRLALGASVATALLGIALEYIQQLVPGRAAYAHPRQIMWSVVGAFVGAFAAASLLAVAARLSRRTLPIGGPQRGST